MIVDAATFDWDFVSGLGKGWRKTVSHERGLSGFEGISSGKAHLMVPAILPPMIEEPCQVGSIRFVAAVESAHTTEIPIRTADDIAADHSVWQSLISGKGSVTIPAQTRRRIIIDLDNYYCAYPFMITSGGAGSIVRVYWDEALYPECDFNNHQKDNRDEIDGKFFFGIGDTFKPDGGDHRLFETLWWETGRFIELYIETADQNLTIEQFGIRETRYPLEMESRFSSSDSRLSEIIPVMVRGLQMCSHETYMDCPFYEQLQYVGDTHNCA